ncbi:MULTISPECIES: hypothetical protein [Paraburkholderia]|jgi:hypothetical protein|uniref:Uncharacterized protein n=1 Tax=Paraburkholderia terricola TaxID=169427 RepID=A0A1M6QQM4_9BURK|nr:MULTISPECIES: hypothetical protein [Paraburkholderia]SDO38934.1 hypothetical protein SAMN05192547_101563 [Paraburkholderia sediminicola]SHK22551.1 hypothetical protein SAMN05192548_101692 [Paraburkholderia terricola]
MSASIQVQVADSHLYPGCSVRIAHLPEPARAAEAIVEFADGSGAHATCHRRAFDELELSVDGYATQKRHPVDAKDWLLLAVDATHNSWRVKRRLP